MGCTSSSDAKADPNSLDADTTNVLVETLPEPEPAPLPPKAPCPPPTCVFTYSKLGHNVKNWKKRYFIVDEGTLSYYESEEAFKNKKDKLGEMILKGYVVTSCTYEGKSCLSVDGVSEPSAVVFLANSPKKSLSCYIFGSKDVTKESKNLVVDIPEESERELISTSIAEHIAYKNYEIVEYPKLYKEYEVALEEYNNPSGGDVKE